MVSTSYIFTLNYVTVEDEVNFLRHVTGSTPRLTQTFTVYGKNDICSHVSPKNVVVAVAWSGLWFQLHRCYWMITEILKEYHIIATGKLCVSFLLFLDGTSLWSWRWYFWIQYSIKLLINCIQFREYYRSKRGKGTRLSLANFRGVQSFPVYWRTRFHHPYARWVDVSFGMRFLSINIDKKWFINIHDNTSHCVLYLPHSCEYKLWCMWL